MTPRITPSPRGRSSTMRRERLDGRGGTMIMDFAARGAFVALIRVAAREPRRRSRGRVVPASSGISAVEAMCAVAINRQALSQGHAGAADLWARRFSGCYWPQSKASGRRGGSATPHSPCRHSARHAKKVGNRMICLLFVPCVAICRHDRAMRSISALFQCS
jgi:hypothetical protein